MPAGKSKTRGAQGSGTIRKKTVIRNDKEYTYWEARVTTGRSPSTGKQTQRSFTGKTQKEVREKLQAAAVALNEGTYFEPSKITLTSWVETWLKDYAGDKKYLTQKHYRAQCNTHIIPQLGAVKLCELSTPQIQNFYNDLRRSGLSPKSIRNIHGILTKCLSVAVQIGYIKSNPASIAVLPKVEKKEISPLTDEQIKKFLQVATFDEYGLLLKVILFTGLRESEAIGLTWNCIDFKGGTVKVCKQLQKRPIADGGFVFAPLKNDKARLLKPAPFVMRLLEQRRNEELKQKIQAGESWCGWQSEQEREVSPVFTNSLGSHLHPQTVYNHYKKIALQIGAPYSRVHDLRHTFAVLSLQNGDDIKTVQSNLGHATASFTLDVYGHVSEKMKDDSAARMEQYIKDISETD